MNLVEIPCVDGFPELPLSAGEIGAIIGSIYSLHSIIDNKVLNELLRERTAFLDKLIEFSSRTISTEEKNQ